MVNDQAHDHRDPWDAADVKLLKLLLAKRGEVTYAQAAARLGRTREAVRSKARRLGLR